jgi:sugar lactone lactonase YvrE
MSFAVWACDPIDDPAREHARSHDESSFDASGDEHAKHHGESTDASKPAHGHDLPKTEAHWYITMHGKPAGNTVHALSGEGKDLGNILENVPESAGGAAKGVRGMLHLGEHGLLVVSANLANTRLIRYGPPSTDGTLPFVSVFESKALKNPDLVHSYALAVGADGTIYASNQDTNTVSAYWGIGTTHPGAPVPVPQQIAGLGIPPGTIVPSALVSPQGVNKVRGIAIGADGLLYVCDKDAAQVLVFDPTTGLRKGVVADESHGLSHPIQLLFAPDGRTLYLTDNGMPGIFRIDTKSGNVVLFSNRATGCPELPSSLAIDRDHLYVGDRKKKQILRFRLRDAEPDHQPFAELPDAPEFMIPASSMPTIPHPPQAPATD